MKVLVATRGNQRTRADDYCFTVEGELVYIQGFDCSNPRCGCDRGFAGMASHRATTTAKVVDRPDLTEADLRAALVDSLDAGGWLAAMDAAGIVEEAVGELLELLRRVTSSAAVGSLVRRTGDVVWILDGDPSHTREV